MLRQMIIDINDKKDMWRQDLEREAQNLKKAKLEYINLQEDKLKYDDFMEDQNAFRK